jgi:hypothetical protein
VQGGDRGAIRGEPGRPLKANQKSASTPPSLAALVGPAGLHERLQRTDPVLTSPSRADAAATGRELYPLGMTREAGRIAMTLL